MLYVQVMGGGGGDGEGGGKREIGRAYGGGRGEGLLIRDSLDYLRGPYFQHRFRHFPTSPQSTIRHVIMGEKAMGEGGEKGQGDGE